MRPIRMRTRHVLAICALPLLLASYQNCAPIGLPQNNAKNCEQNSEASSQENADLSRLQFVSSHFIALDDSQSTFTLNGLCKDGDTSSDIHWTLLESQGESSVESGSVSCLEGAFVIEIQALDRLGCSQTHSLTIENTSGERDRLTVKRYCSS